MEEARSMSQRLMSQNGEDAEESRPMASFMSPKLGDGSLPRRAESIASLGSSMAHHARTLVGQFNCASLNERTDTVLATELAEGREDGRGASRYGNGVRQTGGNDNLKAYATAYGLQQARSFQETQRNAEV